MSEKSHNTTQQSSAGSGLRRTCAVILAAGKGTRMGSDLPKVVHEVAGQPMVRWVVQAARTAGASPVIIVVGHQADKVRELFAGDRDVVFVEQTQQLGTGHAVEQAREAVLSLPNSDDLDVVVLAGDGPLIRAKTILTMIDAHRRSEAAATLATSVITDASGYGRILRDTNRRFEAIIEHKDASEAQRSIREVNPSYYCFRAADLFRTLGQVDNRNANGEFYITDVFGLLRSDGRHIEVIEAVPPEDVLSINTPAQLAEVDAILRRRGESLASRAETSTLAEVRR